MRTPFRSKALDVEIYRFHFLLLLLFFASEFHLEGIFVDFPEKLTMVFSIQILKMQQLTM